MEAWEGVSYTMMAPPLCDNEICEAWPMSASTMSLPLFPRPTTSTFCPSKASGLALSVYINR
jgi:hypothetical protein